MRPKEGARSAPPSHDQLEVIGPEDAAVTDFSDLTAIHELDESGRESTGTVGRCAHAERDDLLSTDAVAIVGGYVPHLPRYALLLAREPLGHTPELG